MSTHRFFLKNQDFIDDSVFFIESEDLVHQWKHVLRFRPGVNVILFDGSGKEFVGEIVNFTNKSIEGKVLSSRIGETELSTRIILAQSILKNPDKFEWVLQKGTELGVSEFYPLVTRRTERESLNKMERLQRILIEAAEQSGRCIVPVLHDPISFEAFLRLEFVEKKQVELIVPHVVADGIIRDVVLNSEKRLAVCIGPEGGFDDPEVLAAQKAGASLVTLGHRVLRSETASLAAVTLLASRIDNF